MKESIQLRKLSTLMRQGATLKPQCKEGYIVLINGILHSCALGAAADAVFLFNSEQSFIGVYDLVNYTGVDLMQPVYHPVIHTESRLIDVIISLNDDYGWTREAIADWLESENL